MGERTIECIGSCTFEDLTNNRKAVILMSTYKKSGWIKSSSSGCKDSMSGIIFDCAKKLTGDAESVKKNYGRDFEMLTEMKQIKDVKKKLCEIEGSWLKNLVIDGKTYWDIERDIPIRQKVALNNEGTLVLPSDWRYREDLIWLKYKFMKIAHQWKLRLEK